MCDETNSNKVVCVNSAEAANEADEESEKTHQEVLQGEIDIGEFISKYRKQRLLYHKRTLTRLAAMTSLTTPG